MGVPNIHLGRGRANTVVKSPKYATAIGLALSGIRALDKRENQYIEQQYQMQANPKAGNPVPEKIPEIETGPNKTKSSFNRIIRSTKNFLMDEIYSL